MMINSAWNAMAYLSQSKYGNIENINETYTSTTGNIYGIYLLYDSDGELVAMNYKENNYFDMYVNYQYDLIARFIVVPNIIGDYIESYVNLEEITETPEWYNSNYYDIIYNIDVEKDIVVAISRGSNNIFSVGYQFSYVE